MSEEFASEFLVPRNDQRKENFRVEHFQDSLGENYAVFLGSNFVFLYDDEAPSNSDKMEYSNALSVSEIFKDYFIVKNRYYNNRVSIRSLTYTIKSFTQPVQNG